MLFIIIPIFNLLFVTIIGYSKLDVNSIHRHQLIKVYLLYWIIIFNWFMSYYIHNLWVLVDLYILFIIRFNSISLFMVFIVILVSSFVIFNSIDYLTIIDSYLFILYLGLFQLTMICFVCCQDLILLFLNWDLLGLISYLLINYWSSKVNCGIKAIIFNRLGDLSMLYLLSIIFSLFNLLGYYGFTSCNLISITITILYTYLGTNYLYLSLIGLSLLFILFTKSAQFPFSSWLLNAMNAPTPISALLHSSTMVIAGVYLGIIVQDSIILIITILPSILSSLFFIIPILTLIWAVFKAVMICDIKAIIALSTISQISYMYVGLLLNPFLCLFHVIIHAVFKSLLFILAGIIIHYTLSYQSIYKMKINHSFIKILFILASCVLVMSLSKEIIIYSSLIQLSLSVFSINLWLGAGFTFLYVIKIYSYLFFTTS